MRTTQNYTDITGSLRQIPSFAEKKNTTCNVTDCSRWGFLACGFLTALHMALILKEHLRGKNSKNHLDYI